MLGDSTSVIAAAAATTTTASSAAAGGGAGGGEGQPQLPPTGGSGDSNTTSNNNSGDDIRGGGGGGGGGGGDDVDRSFGGNRWPRQETLGLLKIRSDMDSAFRDASVKGPLWDEVSRKLAELGYNRSAKKCKEKFENVFKYHKRTKEGRTGKQEGKTYRFFDQLEAFESHTSSQPQPPQPQSQQQLQQRPPPQKPQAQQQLQQRPPPQQPQAPAVTAIAMPVISSPPPPPPPPPAASVSASIISSTVPSTTSAVLATNMSSQGIVSTGISLTIPSFPSPTNPTILPISQATNPTSALHHQSTFPSFSPDLLSNSTSSSSTSSDVEIQGRRRRKRKWKDFFERLMKEVVHKQEDMQKKFLETIEKREHDRMVREESWRMQEMARISREREILAQERSIAAAKDAAVMAFLQKLSEQQNLPAQQQQVHNNQPPQPLQPTPTAMPVSQPQPQPQPQTQPQPPQTLLPPQPVQIPQAVPAATVAVIPPPAAPAPAPAPAPPRPQTPAINLEIIKSDNGDQSLLPASSSRWPKVEVQALINLRKNLDSKYQENGPKGPLWEEISAGMRKHGYNRNAKRCKEKWENINKYFKKVKESNKKRPEDSKTCPYFEQLDALYKEKNKFDGTNNNNISSSSSHVQILKPDQINSVPLMVRPEQQWPPPPPPPPSHHHHQKQQGHHDSVMEDLESEDNQNHQDDDDDDDDDKDMDDDDEEDEASGYEIVANRPTSISSAG